MKEPEGEIRRGCIMNDPIPLHHEPYTATTTQVNDEWKLVISLPQTLYFTVFDISQRACEWAHVLLRGFAEGNTPLSMPARERDRASARG